MRIASTSGIEPEISHCCEMWQPLPRAHNPPMYFTLHARVLIHFRNFLNVPYSLLAKKYYICNVKWQIPVTSHHGKRSLTPISTRRFFGTSRIFSNPADNFKVRHLGVLPSRVLRIALAYTFTGVPYTDSFYRYRAFYSERTGRNYGIILTRPFSYNLHSQMCVLCVCGLKTRF